MGYPDFIVSNLVENSIQKRVKEKGFIEGNVKRHSEVHET